MTISTSAEYFTVAPIWTYTLEMQWRKKNPKASIKERVAKKREIEAERKLRVAKIIEAGYPKERKFQYEEVANRYAAEVERETGVKMAVEKGFDLYL